MSKNKKHKSSGVTPSVGQNFANPTNNSNIATSFYEYTAKDEINKKSKSNKFF